jgi:hypothetical protein
MKNSTLRPIFVIPKFLYSRLEKTYIMAEDSAAQIILEIDGISKRAILVGVNTFGDLLSEIMMILHCDLDSVVQNYTISCKRNTGDQLLLSSEAAFAGALMYFGNQGTLDVIVQRIQSTVLL